MQSFFEYLDRPSPETYEAVRRDVQSDPDFDLLSTALSDLERLVANEDFQAAVDILPQAVPTWLLSPRFHRLAGTAAHNVGNRELAQTEFVISEACMAGLAGTGDGSREAPWQVIHTSDIYDLMDRMELEPVAHQRETRNGRILDVMKSRDGTQYWADVTDSLTHSALQR